MIKKNKILLTYVCGILICGLMACSPVQDVDNNIQDSTAEAAAENAQNDAAAEMQSAEGKENLQQETRPAETITMLEADVPGETGMESAQANISESVEIWPEETEVPECDLTQVPELTESSAAQYSAAQCEPVSAVAPYKELIDSYGYAEDGSSMLSFDIRPGEVKDCGDYYEVEAVYAQAIEVPAGLAVGDSVTLVFNEMTGEEKTLTLQSEGSLIDETGMDYYYWPNEDGSPIFLYWFSDDRVDKPICREKLYIRKYATHEIIIGETVELITEEQLANGFWYNGVYFDEQGYAVRLCFIGD